MKTVRLKTIKYLCDEENEEVSLLNVVIGESLRVVFKLFTVSDELLAVSRGRHLSCDLFFQLLNLHTYTSGHFHYSAGRLKSLQSWLVRLRMGSVGL